MMIKIETILQPLDLGDYYEAYRGTCVQVWVNPTRPFLAEREKWVDENNRRWLDIQSRYNVKAAQKAKAPDLTPAAKAIVTYNTWVHEQYLPAINEWFSRLFSQGPEDTRHSAEELAKIDEQDPALLLWLKRRANEMIEAHRTGQKKE